MAQSAISQWVKNLDLTPKEIRILMILLRERNNLVKRETLVREAWSSKKPSSDRAVDAAISKLRKKLNPTTTRLITVYGGGYRLLISPAQ